MKLVASILIILTIWACDEEKPKQKKDPKWSKEQSIEMQSTFTQEEDEEIESFLKRHPDWKMTKTGTGLRYFIYHKSENNDTAKVGDVVIVDFNITLLDGTQCYSSNDRGSENFMVERTDIESGLHEAMKLMCTGDKAKFILPSHLAHGLIGDLEKIPPLTTVIYDIHLKEIKHNEK